MTMLGKNLLITLLIAFSCAVGGLKGQIVFQLSYDSLNFPNPSTQSYGGMVRYTFNIQNISTATFTDSLHILIKTDSISIDTLVSYDTITIPPQGVFVVDTLDSVVPTRYGGGINVLVIWPTSPSFVATDSITDTLFVLIASREEGFGKEPAVDVFPVPSQMQLFLRPRDPYPSIKETRMLNATGQLIRREDGLPHQIHMEDLPGGIYFIWIEAEDGGTAKIKVLKQ
jgi:hypothetical protein